MQKNSISKLIQHSSGFIVPKFPLAGFAPLQKETSAGQRKQLELHSSLHKEAWLRAICRAEEAARTAQQSTQGRMASSKHG
eukprot:758330-Hanusia_phi.AAC.6